MKVKQLFLAILFVISCLSLFLIWENKQIKIIRLGFYSDSSWGIPTGNNSYVLDEAIKKFEELHPGVKIVYDSGIPKEEYSNWISSQILKGSEPDVFLLSSDQLSLFASKGILKNLNSYLSQEDASNFYDVSLQAAKYGDDLYGLPYESNPMLMCVNQDLLLREGIEIPKVGWTLKDLYEISKKITKDTDGDGIVDQFGITGYSWKESLAAFGVTISESGIPRIDSSEMKDALSYIRGLNQLNGRHKVTYKDFDEGHVAFYPMSLAQYRTYKPFPYHVAKYTNFNWTCISLPTTKEDIRSTVTDTSLYVVSSRARNSNLAVSFIEFLTINREIQQNLFNKGQGSSVLPEVVTSLKSEELMKKGMIGQNALTTTSLDYIMKNSITTISKGIDSKSLVGIEERLEALSMDENNTDIEGSLIKLQKELDIGTLK